MEFRISYWDVFKGLVILNLFALLGVQLSHIDRRGNIPNEAIPYLLVVFNLLLFFAGLADPPLRFIKIDKQANSVTYTFLFHSPKTVNYIWLQSEWITKKRVGRFGANTENILLFKLSDQEIFSISEGSFGWSKKQLDSIHDVVINKC